MACLNQSLEWTLYKCYRFLYVAALTVWATLAINCGHWLCSISSYCVGIIKKMSGFRFGRISTSIFILGISTIWRSPRLPSDLSSGIACLPNPLFSFSLCNPSHDGSLWLTLSFSWTNWASFKVLKRGFVPIWVCGDRLYNKLSWTQSAWIFQMKRYDWCGVKCKVRPSRWRGGRISSW